jgi:hypothetical protein
MGSLQKDSGRQLDGSRPYLLGQAGEERIIDSPGEGQRFVSLLLGGCERCTGIAEPPGIWCQIFRSIHHDCQGRIQRHHRNPEFIEVVGPAKRAFMGGQERLERFFRGLLTVKDGPTHKWLDRG